ncbi:hypothetical protein ES708_23981 [subsurface metagenome]
MAISNKENEAYTQVDIHSLILICIEDVISSKSDCTFERLVYECFANYPKVFGLFRYPQWPDSNKLDRPLRKLRERGLIVGSPKLGFSLTEDGKHKVSRVRKTMTLQKQTKPKQGILKGKERNFVAYIKSTELYQRFEKDRNSFDISEQEFIDLLRGTLETPKRVLKQTLVQYKKLSDEIGDVDLSEFLLACEVKMKTFLE